MTENASCAVPGSVLTIHYFQYSNEGASALLHDIILTSSLKKCSQIAPLMKSLKWMFESVEVCSVSKTQPTQLQAQACWLLFGHHLPILTNHTEASELDQPIMKTYWNSTQKHYTGTSGD